MRGVLGVSPSCQIFFFEFIVFVDIRLLVIFNFKNVVDGIFAELLFRSSGISRLDELNDYIFGALGVFFEL